MQVHIDDDWDIPIRVTVTEEDILCDGVGSASSTLAIDWGLQRQARNKVARQGYFATHGTTSETRSFPVAVVGKAWDEEGLAPTLTIKLKAIAGSDEAG